MHVLDHDEQRPPLCQTGEVAGQGLMACEHRTLFGQAREVVFQRFLGQLQLHRRRHFEYGVAALRGQPEQGGDQGALTGLVDARNGQLRFELVQAGFRRVAAAQPGGVCEVVHEGLQRAVDMEG